MVRAAVRLSERFIRSSVTREEKWVQTVARSTLWHPLSIRRRSIGQRSHRTAWCPRTTSPVWCGPNRAVDRPVSQSTNRRRATCSSPLRTRAIRRPDGARERPARRPSAPATRRRAARAHVPRRAGGQRRSARVPPGERPSNGDSPAPCELCLCDRASPTSAPLLGLTCGSSGMAGREPVVSATNKRRGVRAV
jgi:hypothetical protein